MLIDVSRHQGVINWGLVAPQIEGVIMRATLGATRVDDRFKENWRNSAPYAPGWLGRGVYHYFVTEESPRYQVDNVFRTTGGDFGNLPFTLDCEPRSDETQNPFFDRKAYTANLRVFLWEYLRRTSHPLRIYTAQWAWSFLTDNALDIAAAYPLHVADYRAVAKPLLPTGWITWELWQYTSKGRLVGIQANVDFNRAPEPPPPTNSVVALATSIGWWAQQIRQEASNAFPG